MYYKENGSYPYSMYHHVNGDLYMYLRRVFFIVSPLDSDYNYYVKHIQYRRITKETFESEIPTDLFLSARDIERYYCNVKKFKFNNLHRHRCDSRILVLLQRRGRCSIDRLLER